MGYPLRLHRAIFQIDIGSAAFSDNANPFFFDCHSRVKKDTQEIYALMQRSLKQYLSDLYLIITLRNSIIAE